MAEGKDKGKDKPIPNTIPGEIIQKFIDEHEAQQEERMGQLHNQFTAFISNAKIPLPMVITVLELLLREALDMVAKKYLGE